MTPRYETVTNSSLWNWQTRADFKASETAPNRSLFPERIQTILQNRAEQRSVKSNETRPETKSTANFGKSTPSASRENRAAPRADTTSANPSNTTETSAYENKSAEENVLTTLLPIAIPLTETSTAAIEITTDPVTVSDADASGQALSKTASEETAPHTPPPLLTKHLSRHQPFSATRTENSTAPPTETAQDQPGKPGNLSPFLKALSNGSAATLAAVQLEASPVEPDSEIPERDSVPHPANQFSTPDSIAKTPAEATDSTVVDDIPVTTSGTNIPPEDSSEVLLHPTAVDQNLKPATSSSEKTASFSEQNTEAQSTVQAEASQQSAASYQNNPANTTSYNQSGSAETKTPSTAKLTQISAEIAELSQSVSEENQTSTVEEHTVEERRARSVAINQAKLLQDEQTQDHKLSLAEGMTVSSLSPKAMQDAVKSTTAPTLLNLESPEFPHRLAGYLQQAAETGQSLKIRLNPPELGTLQIEISRQAGQTIALLEVESVAAKTIILEQIALLRDSLQQQGLKLDQLTVEVNEQFAQSAGQESLQQDQSGNPEHHRDHSPAEASENEPNSSTKPQLQSRLQDILNRQQIDVQI